MLSIQEQANNLLEVYNKQEKHNKYWILLYFYLLRMMKYHFKKINDHKDTSTYKQEQELRKDFFKEMNKVNNDITEYIEKHLKDTFIKTWEATLKNIDGKTLLPSEKDILENINQTWVGEKNFKQRQAHNSDIIKKKIKDILNNRELKPADQLQEVENIIKQYRNMIKRLVRTETVHTMGQATLWALRENDVLEVIWIACEDEKTCKICRGRDGMIFDIDIIPQYPDHPNCRCQLIPYFRTKAILRR